MPAYASKDECRILGHTVQSLKLQPTPTQFIDLCHRFRELLVKQRAGLRESTERLMHGQATLNRATKAVDSLRVEVQALEKTVAQKVRDAAEQRDALAAESAKVDAEAQRAKEEGKEGPLARK